MNATRDPFAAADLTAAGKKDADRLAKAEAELAKREAALRAASDQRDAAMQAVLAAGMEGKDDSKAAQSLASANASVQAARELRDLRADVVDAVRAEVLEAVRAERSVGPRQRLDSIRAQYDEQAQLLSAVAAILDRLGSLREAERQAAVDLATARRDGFTTRGSGSRPARGRGT